MTDDSARGSLSVLPQEPQTARKERLLFVLPIVPWPIRRNGISLRFAPIVEYLSQLYELDLLVLAEEDIDGELKAVPQSCHALDIIPVPISSLPAWLRKTRSFAHSLAPSGAPLGSAGFAHRRLERLLLAHLKARSYQLVIWATKHLEIACRIRGRYPNTRFVIDFTDSPTLFSLRDASTHPVFGRLTKYTGWKWRRLERRARRIFDAAIYISDVDASTADSDDMRRVHVVPNGIFHADALHLTKDSDFRNVIGFLGDMSYQPNISAAIRLAEQVFPRVQSTLPDASVLIIGRDPTLAIQRLQGRAISVTGTVEDIWPYVSRATVFVFPMFEGAGLQNKILEAMYARVPVVTTSIAAASIGARSGEQLLIADTDAGLAAQAIKFLRDPEFASRVAERAHSFVVSKFSWPALLSRYEAIIGGRS